MVEVLLWVAIALILVVGISVTVAYRRLIATVGSASGSASEVRDELRAGRDEGRTSARDLRDELASRLTDGVSMLTKSLDSLAARQNQQLEAMSRRLSELSDTNSQALVRIRDAVDLRVKDLQQGNEAKLDGILKATSESLRLSSESLTNSLDELSKMQREKLEATSRGIGELIQSNQSALDRMRATLDGRVAELQASNEKRLDEMRQTVDEKLHNSLEKRLGESFKLVSDRLDAVHKGLGEMQSLATGVGDLRRVLTNVKVRGTWAEVQLGAILEQILTPDQYARNVRVKADSLERVEYAIRLPGADDDLASCVWLPIDSKFPHEDYARLQEAADRGDSTAVQAATEGLLRAIRVAAKEISGKYISPPSTTDFAVMFLATEGLYAEVLRQPAFVEEIQREHRIVIAGPATFAAILTSLQMGFQTLVIEQRAAEVWRVLGAVKTEFGKFGEVLDRVRRQLDTASRTIEETGVRSRAMEKRLRTVEALPEAEAATVLEAAKDLDELETGEARSVTPSEV